MAAGPDFRMRPSRDPATAHPDNEDGVKLAALQHYLRGRSDQGESYVWMDWISIPQASDARKHQMLAISSIPTYFMYSTTMVRRHHHRYYVRTSILMFAATH
eukprot:COSAG01_NODE_4971_length_4580_cov_12.996206_3_plen_102_part_00